MGNLNSILIEGNLVRDPALKITDEGKSMCEFSIININYIKNEETGLLRKKSALFSISTYGSLAKHCGEKLKKNHAVRVVGRLAQSHWRDSQGNKRFRVFIMAEHVECKALEITPTQHQPVIVNSNAGWEMEA